MAKGIDSNMTENVREGITTPEVNAITESTERKAELKARKERQTCTRLGVSLEKITVLEAFMYAKDLNYKIQSIKISDGAFFLYLIGDIKETPIGDMFTDGHILLSNGDGLYYKKGNITNGKAQLDCEHPKLLMGRINKFMHSNLDQLMDKKAKREKMREAKQQERNRRIALMLE